MLKLNLFTIILQVQAQRINKYKDFNAYTRLPSDQHVAGPLFTFRDVLGKIVFFFFFSRVKNHLNNNPSWFQYSNIKVFQKRSFKEFGVMAHFFYLFLHCV